MPKVDANDATTTTTRGNKTGRQGCRALDETQKACWLLYLSTELLPCEVDHAVAKMPVPNAQHVVAGIHCAQCPTKVLSDVEKGFRAIRHSLEVVTQNGAAQ